MQTVNGKMRMYQPAQNPAMNNAIINNINQIMKLSGFFILKIIKEKNVLITNGTKQNEI